jgi:hypothetical protein
MITHSRYPLVGGGVSCALGFKYIRQDISPIYYNYMNIREIAIPEIGSVKENQ